MSNLWRNQPASKGDGAKKVVRLVIEVAIMVFFALLFWLAYVILPP